jgi:hypothetical protein
MLTKEEGFNFIEKTGSIARHNSATNKWVVTTCYGSYEDYDLLTALYIAKSMYDYHMGEGK